MRRGSSSTPSQFLVGFVTAIALMGAVGLAGYVYQEFAVEQQSVIALLNRPLFSIADVVSIGAILLLVWIVFAAPRYLGGDD